MSDATEDLRPAPDADALAAATGGEADAAEENPPLSNYLELPPKKKGGKPKLIPTPINALVREVMERFDGFPRRLGSSLFYHDPDAKNPIRILRQKSDLFAWIQGAGNCLAPWLIGEGFVTQDQLFARLYDKARFYEATTAAPFYPPREDAFPVYGEMPKPDPEHRAFWKLVERFNPADDANRTILAAFVLTPLWYDGINDKPMCLVDTVDAQGSGKTTVVKVISRLYDLHAEAEYLDIGLNSLNADEERVKKQILSADGRSKRIVLFDNISNTLKGDSLAKLVTGGKVSGMAPYGRGVETRPADFTLFGTMNQGRVDEDMASRSYTLRIRKVEDPDPQWETETVAFIRENRLQILADGLDLMESAMPRKRRHKSRFGVYDATVLSAVCRDDAEFYAADDALAEASGRANEDAATAQEFLDRFVRDLCAVPDYDEGEAVVIDQAAVEWLLATATGDLHRLKAHDIRRFIQAGHLGDFSRGFEKLPDRDTFKGYRKRAFFYGMNLAAPGATVAFQFVAHAGQKLAVAFRGSTIKRPDR